MDDTPIVDAETTTVRRSVSEAAARDALQRHLSRNGQDWPDGIADAVVLDLAPVVAPYWALRAEGTCRWAGRWARVRRDHDGDAVVRDEDLEWTDVDGEVTTDAEEVLPAGAVEAFVPSRASARSRRRGAPDGAPLPVTRDAAAAWEIARARVTWRGEVRAGAAFAPPPDAARHELGALTHTWGPVQARLVHYPVWQATLAHADAVFELWVDGAEGDVQGTVPLDPDKVEIRAAVAHQEAARREAREAWQARLLAVALGLAGALVWLWLARH